MRKSIKARIRKAKEALKTFSARGSNCPICKKPFRYGCLHSVVEAEEFLEDRLLRLKVQEEVHRVLEEKKQDLE